MIAALYSASPSKAAPIDLLGEIPGVDGPVTLIIRSEPFHLPVFRDGVIRYRFYPDFSVLTLEASAPGYDQVPVPVEIASATQVDVGRIHLKKRIEEIPAKPDSILPIDFRPPPVTDIAQSFGAPR